MMNWRRQRIGQPPRVARPIAASLLLIAALLFAGNARPGELGSPYRTAGRCGDYPRLPVSTPDGLCVGLVAGPEHGLKMPRSIVVIAPGRFLVADMGSWGHKAGRILALTLLAAGDVRVETLFERLDVPHGLVVGPDGLVYVGEQDEIWRFDPKRPDETRESLVTDFPAEGLHRLKALVFDSKGGLIVNLGAFTDRCEQGGKGRPQWPCPADKPAAKEAALWRLTFDRPGGRVKSFTPLARGLRNSVALALHPVSGLLLQGENNIDLSDPANPPEELNAIRDGAHYGWPYCVGMGDVLPDYRRRQPDCGRYQAPLALLPAHSAPLAMRYELADGLPGLAGKLLVTLHGYRETGHRLIACEVGPDGSPLTSGRSKMAKCEDVISSWSQPLGSPVGLARAADGSLWLTEDKNRTVIVLMQEGRREPGANASPGQEGVPEMASMAPAGWAEFQSRVLKRRCGQCHAHLAAASPEQAWQSANDAGWVDGPEARQWLIVRAMLGEGVRRPMPPPNGLAANPDDAARLRAFLATSAQ